MEQQTLFNLCRNCHRNSVPTFGQYCDSCDSIKRRKCLRAIAVRIERAADRVGGLSEADFDRRRAMRLAADAVGYIAEGFAGTAQHVATCAAHYARQVIAARTFAAVANVSNASEWARVAHDLSYLGSADYERDMED